MNGGIGRGGCLLERPRIIFNRRIRDYTTAAGASSTVDTGDTREASPRDTIPQHSKQKRLTIFVRYLSERPSHYRPTQLLREYYLYRTQQSATTRNKNRQQSAKLSRDAISTFRGSHGVFSYRERGKSHLTKNKSPRWLYFGQSSILRTHSNTMKFNSRQIIIEGVVVATYTEKQTKNARSPFFNY